MKHGLCSRTHALPDEDPAAVAARGDHWFQHFQPRSPDALFLLDECVHATLMADRFHRAHDTAVANQMDDLIEDWEQERWKLVKALQSRLEDDPATAVADLKGVSHGCRWLIGRWMGLGEILDSRGCWAPAECDEALRLLGVRHDPEALRQNAEAYLIFLFNLRCQPVPPEAAMEALLEPGRRPAAYRTHDRARLLLEPEECRALLKETIDDELGLLRATESRLRAEVDPGERAVLLNPAAILQDADEARLYLRYQAEYRSTFHRAHKALLATLGRDAACTPGPDSPSPEPAAGTLLDVDSPREPISDGRVEMAPRNEPVDGSSGPATPGARNEPGNPAVAPTAREESIPSHLAESPETERVAPLPGVAPVAARTPGPAPETNPTARPVRTPQPVPGTDRTAGQPCEVARPVGEDREVKPRRLWDLEDLPRSEGGDRRGRGVERWWEVPPHR